MYAWFLFQTGNFGYSCQKYWYQQLASDMWKKTNNCKVPGIRKKVSEQIN